MWTNEPQRKKTSTTCTRCTLPPSPSPPLKEQQKLLGWRTTMVMHMLIGWHTGPLPNEVPGLREVSEQPPKMTTAQIQLGDKRRDTTCVGLSLEQWICSGRLSSLDWPSKECFLGTETPYWPCQQSGHPWESSRWHRVWKCTFWTTTLAFWDLILLEFEVIV